MDKPTRESAREKSKQKIVKRLYDSVAAYVKICDGSVVVIGGIRIEQWPEDLPASFHVAIKCTGKLPSLAGDKR